jgi:fumarylacetoacetase
MSPESDPTVAADLRSFVDVPAGSHFPIQNLPFGNARLEPEGEARVVSRIGDHVVDLAALDEAGLFDGTPVAGKRVFEQASLNAFMALGRPAWRETRERLSGLLRADTPALRDEPEFQAQVLRPLSEVEMLLPVEIGDYTDFYSSREHATNVGTMFRDPDNALLPNWLHLPVGYHGRASSVILDGEPVRRPRGQTVAGDSTTPTFGPSRLLDFELEMGFFVGPGNNLGQPIPVDRAEEHIFGLVLVNDWSARDIQKWEYVPLGPFNAKNFATSISPWVVTLEALAPFRVPGPKQEPTPLPYLHDGAPWSLDIALEVSLRSEAMRAAGTPDHVIARSNARHLYWNIRQQLAHHTVTGCNARTGDLMASGTISGPTKDSRGSMLEISWRGTEPLTLPSGEERKFLADGDEVGMSGYCQGEGYRVGFGEVRARILPALTD